MEIKEYNLPGETRIFISIELYIYKYLDNNFIYRTLIIGRIGYTKEGSQCIYRWTLAYMDAEAKTNDEYNKLILAEPSKLEYCGTCYLKIFKVYDDIEDYLLDLLGMIYDSLLLTESYITINDLWEWFFATVLSNTITYSETVNKVNDILEQISGKTAEYFIANLKNYVYQNIETNTNEFKRLSSLALTDWHDIYVYDPVSNANIWMCFRYPYDFKIRGLYSFEFIKWYRWEGLYSVFCSPSSSGCITPVVSNNYEFISQASSSMAWSWYWTSFILIVQTRPDQVANTIRKYRAERGYYMLKERIYHYTVKTSVSLNVRFDKTIDPDYTYTCGIGSKGLISVKSYVFTINLNYEREYNVRSFYVQSGQNDFRINKINEIIR